MGVELLRHPTPKSLRAVVRAVGLPVVYLVASEIGGCAIIAGPEDDVRTIRLPALTESRVADVTQLWLDAAAEQDDDRADQAARHLWADAMEAVVAALRAHPRAVLVPVGALGIVPLHAAGPGGGRRSMARRDGRLSLGYAPNARRWRCAATGPHSFQGGLPSWSPTPGRMRISARCPRPSTNARNFATACPKAMSSPTCTRRTRPWRTCCRTCRRPR